MKMQLSFLKALKMSRVTRVSHRDAGALNFFCYSKRHETTVCVCSDVTFIRESLSEVEYFDESSHFVLCAPRLK